MKTIFLALVLGIMLAPVLRPGVASESKTQYYNTKPAYSDPVQQEIYLQSREYGIDHKVAMKIAFSESRFIPDAENHANTDGSNDKGVFQINSIHSVPDSCRLDYKCNIKWAMEEMAKNGFRAWYSSEHKWSAL